MTEKNFLVSNFPIKKFLGLKNSLIDLNLFFLFIEIVDERESIKRVELRDLYIMYVPMYLYLKCTLFKIDSNRALSFTRERTSSDFFLRINIY